jgi:hypothetical protein
MKGDLLADNRRVGQAKQMYQQAIAIYQAIKAKSEDKYEWDRKIDDLREKIRNPTSG